MSDPTDDDVIRTQVLPVRAYGITVWWVTHEDALGWWVWAVRDNGWSPVGEPVLVEPSSEAWSEWDVDLDTGRLAVKIVYAPAAVEGRVVEHPDLTITRDVDSVVVPVTPTFRWRTS